MVACKVDARFVSISIERWFMGVYGGFNML